MNERNNASNLVLSLLLSGLIISGWYYFYEGPRIEKLRQEHTKTTEQTLQAKEEARYLDISAAMSASPRAILSSDEFRASINLLGARIDDLTLLKYKERVDGDEKVRLLAPDNTASSYFIELGWQSESVNFDLPDKTTQWDIDTSGPQAAHTTTLAWTNKEGVEFKIEYAVIDKYLISAKQTVYNPTEAAIKLSSQAIISKNQEAQKAESLIHKGFIGVLDGALNELGYEEIAKKNQELQSKSVDWLGVTDKYWLGAIIPENPSKYNVRFSGNSSAGASRYNAALNGGLVQIDPGQQYVSSYKIFVGAKEVQLLDSYAKKYHIKLFDRAIDFGKLYIITKPLFYVLSFFYGILGNFGLSIIFVTLLLKIALFGLTARSTRAMKKLKELQPRIEKLKASYSHDSKRLNQEIMLLYQQEKFNPLSGCLPILVQIPVLFAVYKVLYVTIEMRHAPFFGWIRDLSAPDSTSVLNLFGLIPIELPQFLHIGIWPVLMSLSMFAQQSISSTPNMDESSKAMLKLMPIMLLFVLANFPAGLMIYWTFSNLFTILQQLYTTRYSS